MSQSNSNLDITAVPNEDEEKLAAKIETYYKNDSAVKSQLAWAWERNHLMLDGKQWIIYDGERETGGVWKRLRVAKENEFIPRPVTNYVYDAYQTLKSYLLKSKPRSTVRPNTQTHSDKQAAKISNLILECNWERLKEDYNYEYAAANAIIYGTVFKKTYWDTTSLSMAKVPKMEQRPQMDPMTGAVIGIEEVPMVDENGDQVYDELPLGDVATSIVEPYRVAIDPLASDLHNARWIMEYSIQPLEWIKETYDRVGDGYTGNAEKIKEERALSNSMRRFFNLKTSSGIKTTGFTTGESTTAADDVVENAAVVKEYYERPSPRHPKGRLVVIANGLTLYAGDSPYTGPEMGDWHPYSECRWELVPGRFWGKSPLDDGSELQKQINSIDSVLILTRKTMAVPQKLVPVTSGVQPGTWTGRPGQEIYYRNDGTGAKPETILPSGVDAQVFREREQRVEDFKQITGAIDILKGDRPPGVNAASALNLLYEVGTGKLFPILNRWKMFVESDQKKQLKLIASKYKEPRPEFIRLLHSKNKEVSPAEINNFIGKDLHDNCNVVVEAGSNVPKLQAAQQALLMELAQVGVLGLETPENRIKFLERMGINDFGGEVSADIKRAEWENDLLQNVKQSPDNAQAAMVLPSDDHETHINVHERRMKEPSFMDMDPEAQQALMAHIEEHRDIISQMQQQQMMEAMATGAPPPQGPAGPASTTPTSTESQGKGAPNDIKEALMAADMPPGSKV